MLCCRHVNHFTSIAAMVHTYRHHGCDRPPAIITKVLVLSVSTKQMLSMVDAVKCPVCLYMLHQPIDHAMPLFVVGVLRSGFVSLYDSSAPAAIQSPVFSPPCSYQPQSLSFGCLVIGCVTGYQVIRVIRIFAKTYPFE